MGDGRRNKGTTKHAGVVLQRRALPSGAVSWRARWTDPDSKAVVWGKALSAEDAATEESRAAWAIAKKKEIEKRAVDLEEGAAPKTGKTLKAAVDEFFEKKTRLRDGTRDVYRLATDVLIEWADEERIVLADELTPPKLTGLRDWIESKPRRGHTKGDGPRSAQTCNRELRTIKTVLTWLRKKGGLPFLNVEAIKTGLEALRAPKKKPVFLRAHEIAKLIEAAGRHDEDTFDLTREEKARGLTKGSTPRHAPILPYLALVLLTGMRRNEARLLRWASVDLDAAPAGLVSLSHEDVKTSQWRDVDLAVSPLLHSLLATMKLAAGDRPFVFQAPADPEGGPPRAFTEDELVAALRRLMGDYGSPKFSWQTLRRTCETYLTNAPGIFGAASVYRAARQLGHSVQVAQDHYLGVVHVDPAAKTLEAAMSIEAKLREALGLEAAPASATATG